jgi:hypothetical protein
MATDADVDNNDDDNNNTSLTTSDKGDNRNQVNPSTRGPGKVNLW